MYKYDDEFFKEQEGKSYASAAQILPLVFDLIHPKSVLDLGCGVGTWLKACLESGVSDVVGVDGPYVDPKNLHIPESSFQGFDLTTPLNLKRKFDLAISLEVAEHLPEAAAETFVHSLTMHAPVVLFSAAIPYQGGTHHLNEQWQSYWAELFADEGYVPVDCVRPAVWKNASVEWWYAQNALLYVDKRVLANYPKVAEWQKYTNPEHLSMVHPLHYLKMLDVNNVSVAKVIRSIPGRIGRRIS